ncbi:hypothetical protein ZIOFF_075789 [Zingiber officinale]|uniref:Uncharacterized protein n=1 Tax=Zingiber officinale TaxID=94328 RepID=A0A8J5C420_ZINOF|nr:hypothetical protein ZIOFF_075789 [Zingiber officinale]
MQGESPISDIGHTDTSKLEHPFSSGSLEKTQNQVSHSQQTDRTQLDKQYFGDGDKIYPNHAILEASKENEHYKWDHEPSRGDANFPRHHGTSFANSSSINKAQKHNLRKQIHLRKTNSATLRQERQENILPLLYASNEKRTTMVSSSNDDVAREYLEKVAGHLLVIAQAGTLILKCINNLSMDPNCLESLQRADAIKYLIPNLELSKDLVSRIHSEVLNALFNLCKINKKEAGTSSRKWNYSTLDEFYHFRFTTQTICIASARYRSCFSKLKMKVEQALLKKESIQKLVKYFQNCLEQYIRAHFGAFSEDNYVSNPE